MESELGLARKVGRASSRCEGGDKPVAFYSGKSFQQPRVAPSRAQREGLQCYTRHPSIARRASMSEENKLVSISQT